MGDQSQMLLQHHPHKNAQCSCHIFQIHLYLYQMSRRTKGLIIFLAVVIVGVAIGLIVFFAIRAANSGNPLTTGRPHHITHLHTGTFGRSMEFRDTTTATFNNNFTIFSVSFTGDAMPMQFMVTNRRSNRNDFNANLVSIVNGEVMHFRMHGTSASIRLYRNLRYDVRTEIRDGSTYYHYYYVESLVLAFSATAPSWQGGGG